MPHLDWTTLPTILPIFSDPVKETSGIFECSVNALERSTSPHARVASEIGRLLRSKTLVTTRIVAIPTILMGEQDSLAQRKVVKLSQVDLRSSRGRFPNSSISTDEGQGEIPEEDLLNAINRRCTNRGIDPIQEMKSCLLRVES